MLHRLTMWIRLLPVFLVTVTVLAQSPSAAHNEVLIKNAVLMTVTHGTIQNGSLHIKDGKIAAVGANVSAPASAAVIDADRKSTRLNSSHVAISYAVFCLK